MILALLLAISGTLSAQVQRVPPGKAPQVPPKTEQVAPKNLCACTDSTLEQKLQAALKWRTTANSLAASRNRLQTQVDSMRRLLIQDNETRAMRAEFQNRLSAVEDSLRIAQRSARDDSIVAAAIARQNAIDDARQEKFLQEAKKKEAAREREWNTTREREEARRKKGTHVNHGSWLSRNWGWPVGGIVVGTTIGIIGHHNGWWQGDRNTQIVCIGGSCR